MKLHKVLIVSVLSFCGIANVVAQQPTTAASDCSNLSPDEKIFADKLNAQNKTVFCSKFNGDQRKTAMNNAGTMGQDGTLVTNDQSVEKVANDNNIMIPKPPARPGGSCPVK
jgi:hypothetical protein